MRRSSTLVVVAAALLAAVHPPPVVAGSEADVLRRAAEAAATLRYAGTVRVHWVDGAGSHDEVLAVKGYGGAVALGDQATVGITWAGGVGITSAAPDPARKYAISLDAGPTLLGRSTTRVVLSRGGSAREVVDLDKRSGLVLRRQLLGPGGAVVREVEVLALEETSPAGHAPAAKSSAWKAPRLERVPSPYRAPESLAAGYERLGLYRRGDAVQALYGDGVHTLSVFLQPGEAKAAAYPAGGQLFALGAGAGRQWSWAGGSVFAWTDGPTSTTVVGDGHTAEVLEAALSLPGPTPPPITRRVRRACREAIALVA